LILTYKIFPVIGDVKMIIFTREGRLQKLPIFLRLSMGHHMNTRSELKKRADLVIMYGRRLNR